MRLLMGSVWWHHAPFTQPAFCTTPGVYVQLTPLMGESHGGWEGPKGVAQGHTQVWPCLVQ